MQQFVRTLVVRCAGGTLADQLLRALKDRGLPCEAADDLQAALRRVRHDKGQPVHLLVVPIELLPPTAQRHLRQVLAAQPLVRVVVTHSRLSDREAAGLDLNGGHVVLSDAVAVRRITTLVERLRDGPLPGLAMPVTATSADRRLAELGAARKWRGHGERIAVVGRDTAILNLLVDVLAAFGYEVSPTRHVDRAVEGIRPGGFRLVIFDVSNEAGPVADRIRECRASAPDVSALALVPFADTAGVDILMRAGASACLPKPFEVPDLLWEVRRGLRTGASDEPPLVTEAEMEALLGGSPIAETPDAPPRRT